MQSILIKLMAMLVSTSAFAAAGKLQNADFATSASILAASGSLNQLLNTSKVWDDVHSQLLDTTLAGAGSGTVTSVAQTVPSFLSVAGSPVTTAGTLAITLATQSAATVFAGPATGSATSPSFRALVSGDIPSLPYQASGSYITALTGDATAAGPGSAALTLATVNGNVGSFGSASNSINFTVNAKGLVTAASTNSIVISQSQVTGLQTALANAGTVTSVNLTAPGIFSVTGVPITGSGTIAITNSVQAANTVYAGPGSAGATSPSFRALVSADIPAISLASGVNNVLPIANGGTAASVASTAFNNLSPLTTSGDILVYNGSTNTRVALGSNAQVLTADNTVTGGIKWAAAGSSATEYSAQASHGSNCQWNNGTNSYVDPSGGVDTTCTFTQLSNVNLTVTSYNDGTPGNQWPGIVFTPVSGKDYLIMAQYQRYNTGSASNNFIELYDGTTGYCASGTGLQDISHTSTLFMIVHASSTSPITISTRMKTPSGSEILQAVGDAPTISWTIHNLN